MFDTKYYIKYNSKHINSCSAFSFLHNFKLKTEVIIDWKSLLVTELTSHVSATFPFEKLQYVQKNTIYCLYIDTKCDDKDFRQFKQWKKSTLLSLTKRCSWRIAEICHWLNTYQWKVIRKFLVFVTLTLTFL